MESAGADGVTRPLVLDPRSAAPTIEQLHATGRIWSVHDTFAQQLRSLVQARARGGSLDERAIGRRIDALSNERLDRWVYYPWSGRLVRLLAPEPFRELRSDRNHLKITVEEQESLRRMTVGVVGLSVGNAVAITLALEGIVGHLRLADFDRLELSNMNRVRADVAALGLRKTVLAARQIAEFDPYLDVHVVDAGVTTDNITAFFDGGAGIGPPLDIVVDECDSFPIKFALREQARTRRIPVLMETSDRGVLDVERFDLEPERALFHGGVGDITSAEVARLETDGGGFPAFASLALQMAGADTLSPRMAASLFELDVQVSTWPQLASEVVLGGASVAVAVRRIGLSLPLPSGRRIVDLEQAVAEPEPATDVATTQRPTPPTPQVTDPGQVPAHVRSAVAGAALAPSGGNSQPWRFAWHETHLDVIHDPRHSTTWFDRGGHAARLALGAAIENALVAAAADGYATDVTLEPDAATPDIVARLHFKADDSPSLQTLSSLAPAIAARRTDRRMGDGKGLSPGEVALLAEAAKVHGCVLEICSAPAARLEVGQVIGAADRLRMLNPHLHRDMMQELRWSAADAQRSRDGLTLSSLDLPQGRDAVLRLLSRPEVAAAVRGVGGGSKLALDSVARAGSAAAVCLLSTGDSSTKGWLRGGRALQRVWLEATRGGLAVQPMTAVLYMVPLLDQGVFDAAEASALRDLDKRLYRVFTRPAGAALMVLRLMRSRGAIERSLRRPVDLEVRSS